MAPWSRLERALSALPAESLDTPQGGRVGAVLVLLRDPGDGDLEVVLTKRREDLSHHPGQISFPGGRVDPGETVEEAAIREAEEEVGLRAPTVELLGRLPAFYIPPSRFWLQTVLARWHGPHPLEPAEAEVDEILVTRLSTLCDRERWRVVHLSTAAHTWAWQLDDGHLLWGATAIVTAVLLGMIDPEWHTGMDPAALPPELEVRPWEHPERAAPRRSTARLGRLPELGISAVDVAAAPLPPPTSEEQARSAGAVLAAGARMLLPGATGCVLVLVGGGGKGRAGAAAATALATEGLTVLAILGHPQAANGVGTQLAAAGVATTTFDGTLPQADVVIDALVGSGLRGSLRGEPLEVVRALRHLVAPVITVDLPSGLHPQEGLVGDLVTADVTVAIEAPRSGLLRQGLAPFVGDLYLVSEPQGPAGSPDTDIGFGEAPMIRLVPDAPPEGWRE